MTEHVDAGTSMDLARYGGILRRRWRVVATCLCLGVVASGLYLALVPQKLTAATLVQINVITSDPFTADRSSADVVDGQTEVQLARSSRVLVDAAEALPGAASPADLRAAMEVTLLPEATVVRIAYTGESEKEARETADAIAQAYLEFRSAQAAGRIDVITTSLEERRSDARANLREANSRLAKATPGSAAATQAESDRQAFSADLDSLLAQINSFNAIDTSGGVILTSAQDATVSASPQRTTFLMAGLFGGLLLGIVLAFVINVLDRRVRDPYDVSGAGGGAVLTRLTSTRGNLAVEDADDDAIRSLRERLLASLPTDDPVLSIIEVNGGHEQVDVHVKLARSIVASGVPVELIVPEHSVPSIDLLHELLSLKTVREEPGWHHLRAPLTPGLTVTLASRKDQSGAPADLVSERLRSGSQAPGLTLIAMPPDSSRALRLVAGRLGHAVVLIVSEGETRIDQLARLSTELRAVGAVVHGSVLVPRGRRLEHHPERAKPAASQAGPNSHSAAGTRPRPMFSNRGRRGTSRR